MVLISGIGFGAGAAFLLSRRAHFDLTLSSRGSLLVLMLTAIVSVALVALGHILVLMWFGILTHGRLSAGGPARVRRRHDRRDGGRRRSC